MRNFAIVIAGLASILFAGCETTQPKVDSKPAPVLTKIQIVPDNPTVTVGTTIELDAKGLDQYDNPFSISPVWAVTKGSSKTGTLSAPKVAGDKAVFAGLSTGQVTIQVSQNGIKVTTVIQVSKVSAAKAAKSFK